MLDTATSLALDGLDAAPAPAVRAQALTRRYGDGEAAVDALRGVTLDVPSGQFTAVMGPSGSGKSTLMHLLAGLDRPSAGHVLVGGQDLTTLSDNALTLLRRRHIGFVFQTFNLLPTLTAEENVRLPLAIARRGDGERAVALLGRVGLGDRRDHRPSELSGGQQQRVAIARALVTEPTVLLADEPTGNLDSRTSIEVMALFQELNDQGITVILVTHEPDVAQYAKRIIEMRDGHILRDHPVTDRHIAVDDLAALDATAPMEEEVAA
jgi:putative ABC transport system ATP-binding protein